MTGMNHHAQLQAPVVGTGPQPGLEFTPILLLTPPECWDFMLGSFLNILFIFGFLRQGLYIILAVLELGL